MDMVSRVHILDETVAMINCSDTLGKSMYRIILPPAIGK